MLVNKQLVCLSAVGNFKPVIVVIVIASGTPEKLAGCG